MKQRTIRLINHEVLNTVMRVLAGSPVDGTVEVVIRPHKSNRTDAQNRLMWLWHTDYGKQYGCTKMEAYDLFKDRFVLPILLANDEDGSWSELYVLASQSQKARDRFIDLIRTSDLDVEKFSEALTEYDHWAGSNGIRFPHPEDLYWEAMGR